MPIFNVLFPNIIFVILNFLGVMIIIILGFIVVLSYEKGRCPVGDAFSLIIIIFLLETCILLFQLILLVIKDHLLVI